MCVCLSLAYVQAVRGLLIIGLSLGLVATALAFFGLECTHLGGDPRSKDDTLRRACAVHVLGCEWDLLCFSELLVLLVFSPVCHLLSLMQVYQTWQRTVYT